MNLNIPSRSPSDTRLRTGPGNNKGIPAMTTSTIRHNTRSLRLQYALGRMAVFLLAPLAILVVRYLGYRIDNLGDLRKSVKRAMNEHRGGWIICANHLTMIDSVIVAWALMPLTGYMIRFRHMPWNLPERENFQKNLVLALLCYLTKCIPIHRGGDRDELKRTMETCTGLLDGGATLLIFPEGGRSRRGLVNRQAPSYGVGRLVRNSASTRVLCVYIRGLGQKSFSSIPRSGEVFIGMAEPFQPRSGERGLRGQRETARQIVEQLALMEEDWLREASKRETWPAELLCRGEDES